MNKPKKVMSDAQKKAMADGRARKAKIKKSEDSETSNERKIKVDTTIIGYSYPEAFSTGLLHSYPIFISEKETYKGKIYKSPEDAMNAYKE